MFCYTLLCPTLTSKLCILATDLIEPRISSLWKQILVTVNIPHAVRWFSTKNRVEKEVWMKDLVHFIFKTRYYGEHGPVADSRGALGILSFPCSFGNIFAE